jgi:hypothetical protein
MVTCSEVSVTSSEVSEIQIKHGRKYKPSFWGRKIFRQKNGNGSPKQDLHAVFPCFPYIGREQGQDPALPLRNRTGSSLQVFYE